MEDAVPDLKHVRPSPDAPGPMRLPKGNESYRDRYSNRHDNFPEVRALSLLWQVGDALSTALLQRNPANLKQSQVKLANSFWNLTKEAGPGSSYIPASNIWSYECVLIFSILHVLLVSLLLIERLKVIKKLVHSVQQACMLFHVVQRNADREFRPHPPLQERIFVVERTGVYVCRIDAATGQALTALQAAPPLEASLVHTACCCLFALSVFVVV